MTAKELLNPRYEVIAEYPISYYCKNYVVGDILELKEITTDKLFHNNDDFFVGNFFTQSDLEKYPHLFRKLNWWEHRKIDDMPKKLICKAISNDEEISIIQSWDMDLLVGWTNKANRQCCDLTLFNPEYGYFPID